MPFPNKDTLKTINHHKRNRVTTTTSISNIFSGPFSPYNNTTDATYQETDIGAYHESGNVTATTPKSNTFSNHKSSKTNGTMPDAHRVTFKITLQ
jgi:hypothetical protein